MHLVRAPGTGGPRAYPLTRRQVLLDLGWGGVAVAILAGCGSGSGTGATTGSSTTRSDAPTATPSRPTSTSTTPGSQLSWHRANLGFVSAYVLVRGREAAVVDTGVTGGADAIGSALTAAGSGWDAVREVVLTHHHSDHAGSLAEVLGRATRATTHAGEADIPQISSSRPISAVADGADVMGLRVVATPGHTLGHICVFDEQTRVLVAGDALTNTAGLAGSNPQHTADAAMAEASVRKLAALDVDTILFGHGGPMTDRSAAALRTLAGSR